jgi:hypothetical protein
MIDLFSVSQGRGDDEAMGVPVSLYLLGRNYNNVHSLSCSVKVQIYISRQTLLVELSSLDYQQIHVTVWAHLAPNRGPEQDNSFGLGHFNNSPDDFLEILIGQLPLSFHLTHSFT